jgi:hypothetical protein
MKNLPHWNTQVPDGEHLVVMICGDSSAHTLLSLCKRMNGHLLDSYFTVPPTETENSVTPLLFHGGNSLHRSLNHARNATYIRVGFFDSNLLQSAIENIKGVFWSVDYVAHDPNTRRLGSSPTVYFANIFFSVENSDSIGNVVDAVRKISPNAHIFDPNAVGVHPDLVPNKQLYHELASQFNPHGLLNPGKSDRLKSVT